MLAPGSVIGGRYRLVSVLGQGGMGVVWAAKNEAIDRDVAIKLMLPELARDEGLLRRFFSEARICGSIRHPGIVDVLDLGTTGDGAPFLVMELLDGQPLDSVIARAGRLAPAAILPIARDVALTVELAHQKGIVHRDIKPGNIFLHRSPAGGIQVKVLDFGISKILGAPGSTTHTRTGSMIGSPAYMSPEQADGRTEVDHRTDVYAIGVLLYEALSGQPPFADAPTPNALLIDIVTRDVPHIGTVAPDVPPSVAEIVHGCLARDRDRRYPSAAALAARIDVELRALGAAPSVSTAGPAAVSAATAPGLGPQATTGAHFAGQPAEMGATLSAGPASRDPLRDSATRVLGAAVSAAPVQTVAPMTHTYGRTATGPSGAVVAIGVGAACLALVLVGVGARAWMTRSAATATTTGEGIAAPPPSTAAPEVVPAEPTPEPEPEPSSSAAAPASASAAAPPGSTPAPPVARPRPTGRPAKSPGGKPKDKGAWGFD